MPSVNELAFEVVSAVEVFFLGKGPQYYNNAAFILADDYTELASKLFLIKNVFGWQDKDAEKMDDYLAAKTSVEAAAASSAVVDPTALRIFRRGEPRGKFKNYHAILTDVHDEFTTSRAGDVPSLDAFHGAMKDRRETRNNLVHTSGPLGMQVSSANCVEALCDLIDYACLLFGADWEQACTRARRIESYKVLLHLERHAQSDPALRMRIDRLFQERRRQDSTYPTRGAEVLRHGNDLYTHLCLSFDSDHALRTALQTLLAAISPAP